MENLNLYIYDVIHYEYFLTFEDSINRFNKLKILILDSQSFFPDDKKREFPDLQNPKNKKSKL